MVTHQTKKCLVTGGAGFIGRHLVGELIQRGNLVVVVDSGETGRIDLLPDGVEVIKRDISELEIEEWRQLISDFDIRWIFHLAARKHNTPGVTFDQMQKTNLTATWRLGKACAGFISCRMILASSVYVYPLQSTMDRRKMKETDPAIPFSVYGMTKLAAENALSALQFSDGLDSYSARMYFVYGPGQFAEGGYKSVIVSNFERLRKGEAPSIFGDGQQTLDYIFVGDVVRALLCLAELPTSQGSGSRVFNLASGDPYSVEYLTQEMLATSGVELKPNFTQADWTAGTWRVGDPRRIEREVGWSVQTKLQEGLKSVWQDINRIDG